MSDSHEQEPNLWAHDGHILNAYLIKRLGWGIKGILLSGEDVAGQDLIATLAIYRQKKNEL